MTVGSIIGGGFRVVREQPGAVGIWATAYYVWTLVTVLILHAGRGTGPLAASGGSPSIAVDLSSMIGPILLILLGTLGIVAALFAAAQRAVLRPERKGFAFLGFGGDELRLFGLVLIHLPLLLAATQIPVFFVALFSSLFALSAGSTAAILLKLAGLISQCGLTAWLLVRLSLAYPLTLIRGRIVIAEAWRISRDRFWTLLGALALIALLLVLVLWIISAGFNSWSYFAGPGASPQAVPVAYGGPLASGFEFTAYNLLAWAASSAVVGVAVGVFGGAVATVVWELTGHRDRLAETFA